MAVKPLIRNILVCIAVVQCISQALQIIITEVGQDADAVLTICQRALVEVIKHVEAKAADSSQDTPIEPKLSSRIPNFEDKSQISHPRFLK